MERTNYGITVTKDGYAVVTWESEEGSENAELDVNSKDVAEALALLRKVIWGDAS